MGYNIKYTPSLVIVLALVLMFSVAPVATATTGGGPKSLGTVKQVLAGGSDSKSHACAITTLDQLSCWGGEDPQSFVPSDLGKVKQVAANNTGEACAITIDSTLRCWGSPGNEILSLPSNLGAVSQVSVTRSIACAIRKRDSALVCWGSYLDKNGIPRTAAAPADLGSVTSVVTSPLAACVVQQISSNPKCWQWGGSEMPLPLELGAVKQMSLGSDASDGKNPEICFIDYTSHINCFGYSFDDTDSQAIWEPDFSSDDIDSAVKQIAVGNGFGCAVLSDKHSTTSCWSTEEDGARPAVLPPALKSATNLSAGLNYVCAILPSKTISCWGDDQHGDLSGIPTLLSKTNSVVKGSSAKNFTINPADWKWSNNPSSLAYQWQRSSDGSAGWVSIAKANSLAYPAAVGDKFIRLCVAAQNTNGTYRACSSTRGTPHPKFSLSLSAGIVSANIEDADTSDLMNYQWERYNSSKKIWTAIKGANKISYTITSTDKNSFLRLTIQGVNSLGKGIWVNYQAVGTPLVDPMELTSQSGYSSLRGPYEKDGKLNIDLSNTQFYPFYSSSDLSVSGVALRLPDVSVHYQWQRSSDGFSGWTAIGGDSSSYTPVAADQGKFIGVCVTTTNATGTSPLQCFANVQGPPSLEPSSFYDTIIPDGNIFAVATDSLQWDGWSNGESGVPDGTPASVTYRWQVSSSYRGIYTDISGANTSSWSVTNKQKDKIFVRACITAKNILGSADYCFMPYGVPYRDSVPGPTFVGSIWSVDVSLEDGAWLVDPDSIATQWQISKNGSSGWTNITAASKTTYTPMTVDKNKYLRLCITGINGWGSSGPLCNAGKKVA